MFTAIKKVFISVKPRNRRRQYCVTFEEALPLEHLRRLLDLHIIYALSTTGPLTDYCTADLIRLNELIPDEPANLVLTADDYKLLIRFISYLSRTQRRNSECLLGKGTYEPVAKSKLQDSLEYLIQACIDPLTITFIFPG